jgi:hypothetical protein
MLRLVGVLLLVLAGALAGVGGFVLADAISFANGCRDECHAAGYWGAIGLLLLCVGLLVFVVSMLVLTSERQDDEAERHDRWLRELQLRLPRD